MLLKVFKSLKSKNNQLTEKLNKSIAASNTDYKLNISLVYTYNYCKTNKLKAYTSFIILLKYMFKNRKQTEIDFHLNKYYSKYTEIYQVLKKSHFQFSSNYIKWFTVAVIVKNNIGKMNIQMFVNV